MLEQNNHRSVTVKDIARETGLSASTVSAVLNNRHVERRISAASVQKVLKSARDMSYLPNIAARRLRDHAAHSRQIFLSILTTYEAPLLLVSQALRSLQSLVDKETDSVIIVRIEMFRAGRLKDLPGLIEGRRTNGAIITNTVAEDDTFLSTATLPFPVVLLGRSIPGYPSVSEHPDEVGRRAADILSSIGRKRFGILCPELLTQATQGRLNAFVQRAVELTGLVPAKIVSPTLTAEGGCKAMAAYLKMGGNCDGLFSLTDSLAVGGFHAIKAAGRTIPGDIAVVGVGDHDAGPFLEPPLTSFATAQEALNDVAARILMSLIKGESTEDIPREVPVTTILRGSTGHVPEKNRTV